ncbi:uncharacterized protein [Chelonus insularis]|uniref:uncharacterized protein n=1 Tax=Chelonus insularis TaxID=460826 RepID=UPI00158876A4|nr:uncharacterized protein LOC118067602 [Chelonus insularis]
MEAREIYNLTFHELITATFAVDWSDDNQISIITEKGIHILELQPNPLCVQPIAKFKRSFIYASSFLPCEPFLPVINRVINHFDKEDLYLFMLEVALTPKLDERNEQNPRIVAAAWSPKKLVNPSKCLLVTITSTGAVDLTCKVGNKWYSVYNLSFRWWKIIENELEFKTENIQVNSVDAESFKKNLRRLLGTTVTWSELFDKSTVFCYLVTAYRSCDLVIWKIMRLAELSMKVEPIIAYRTAFDTEVKITQLLWITLSDNKYLIIIGFFDGKIYGLYITETDDCITQKSIYKYEPNADHISVNYLKEFSRSNNEINIIVIKNFFFIVMTLNHEGKFVKQQHIQLTSLSISGLTLIDQEKAMVITRDSQMFTITFKKGLKLTSEPVKHDLKTSKIQFLGIAVAPNHALFVNVTSPNCLYDHLINREPSSLQLFNLKGEKWDPWLLLNKKDSCLYTHWNCLETIRIKASKELEPEKLLPSIPEDFKYMSVDHLRIIMWLTLITDVLKKKKILKKIDRVIGEISKAQPLIFVHAASSHIIKLSQRKELSNSMRLSIHFLRLYLEEFLSSKDKNIEGSVTKKLAEHAIDLTTKMELVRIESCSLCSEVITELPWKSSSCPKGHQLPRCALTLLHITCLKYRNCTVCGRIFHPSLDEIYDEVNCLYCDLPAVYDSRIANVYDNIDDNFRNLSLRPSWDLQNSKIQDSETLAVSEKPSKKRRTNTGDSFTLIINKDDETITETWQEL